jgi:hypothetical protein
MSWYSISFSRYADRWVMVTPGEIVPGAYKGIEPVYTFAPDDLDSLFARLDTLIAEGFPKTDPPTRQYVGPEVRAVGASDWKEAARRCYQWIIRYKEGEGHNLKLIAKGKHKPAFDSDFPSLESIKMHIKGFNAYVF